MSALEQGELRTAYQRTRRHSAGMVEGLSAEDCMVQSMPDTSPVKWHLAHTSWFFETFVLERAQPGFHVFNPAFRILFNSYYVGVGERHPRPERGMLSRPSLSEVHAYRRAIDEQMTALLDSPALPDALLDVIGLGIHHEQQHQELILTDLKHHFWRNPLRPAYQPPPPHAPPPGELHFISLDGGLAEIGHAGPGFAFDNESPRHQAWLEPFQIATRLVSNREYQAFIADGGYRRPELWLSDGWDALTREGWQAPLYWDLAHDTLFTLHGQQPLDPNAPLSHVSYYEADAYARWASARLPTEQEWECAARAAPAALDQLYDAVWQWTQSAYLPYPGFQPTTGAVGEYNGKFMINQMVLRGSSLATPFGHERLSYRNFFYPAARWQFSGVRLADYV